MKNIIVSLSLVLCLFGSAFGAGFAPTQFGNNFTTATNAIDGRAKLGVVGRNIKTDFGAVGDGVIFTGAYCTNGNATLTITSGSFTTNSVNKVITIYLAGSGLANHSTTIASFVSSNVVTLTAAPTANVTNSYGVFGTDDTAAIQTALTTVGTNVNGGKIIFPNSIYIVNGAPTGTNRAQLSLPTVDPKGQTAPVLILEGESQISPRQYSSGVVPMTWNNAPGAMLWCTLATGGGATNKFLGSMNYTNPAYTPFACALDYIAFNSLSLHIKNLAFRFPANPQMIGLDLLGCPTAVLENVYIDAGYQLYSSLDPTYTKSFGVRMAAASNAGGNILNNVYIIGFFYGLGFGEHVTSTYTLLGDCRNGVAPTGSGHWNMMNLDFEDCATNFGSFVGSCAVGMFAVVTSENPATNNLIYPNTGWTSPGCMLNDPGSSWHGRLTYENFGPSGVNIAPLIIGAANISINWNDGSEWGTDSYTKIQSAITNAANVIFMRNGFSRSNAIRILQPLDNNTTLKMSMSVDGAANWTDFVQASSGANDNIRFFRPVTTEKGLAVSGGVSSVDTTAGEFDITGSGFAKIFNSLSVQSGGTVRWEGGGNFQFQNGYTTNLPGNTTTPKVYLKVIYNSGTYYFPLFQ